jgi:hypothetical protein
MTSIIMHLAHVPHRVVVVPVLDRTRHLGGGWVGTCIMTQLYRAQWRLDGGSNGGSNGECNGEYNGEYSYSRWRLHYSILLAPSIPGGK